VNWGHVNANVTVITMNLRDFRSDWPKEFTLPTAGQRIQACRAYSTPGTLQQSPLNWAGVERQWLRLVCFCDYRYVPQLNIREELLTFHKGFKRSMSVEQICHSATELIVCVIRLPVGNRTSSMTNIERLQVHDCSASISGLSP
jgi:hypothetical protein